MRIASSKIVHGTLALLTLVSPLAGYAMGIQVMIGGQAVIFKDVPQSTWFAVYVQQAAEAGIVNGYKDTRGNLTGKFGPENSITTAEALKIAIEGAGYDVDLYGSLVDSDIARHWASSYVAVSKSEAFGFPQERANLDRAATRSEVAAIFTSAFRVNIADISPVDTRYTDVSTKTAFAASIEALSRDKVVSGDTDINGQATGTFRPGDQINRAEVAKIVIAARAAYGEPGVGRSPSASAETTVVSYTKDGFSPQVLHVKQGDTVTFRNDSSEDLRVASNPHPMHTDLQGFDSIKNLGQGGIYSFIFARLGTWGYHNHLHAAFGGTIIVE